ncbi:MAG: glycosyltransferase family 4 protein [Pseudomonadota bacterium]
MAQARRIVIINDSSIARGGATALALSLAFALRKHGREVTFFAGDKGDNPDFDGAGIAVEALGGARINSSRRKAFLNGIHNRSAYRKLLRYIQSQDGDDVVYHVHGWAQILSPAIFGALKRVRGRVLLTAHDFFYACPNGNYTNFQKTAPCALKPMSLRCATSHCDKRNYGHKIWRLIRQANLRRILPPRAGLFPIMMIQPDMATYLARGAVRRDALSTMTNPAERLLPARVNAAQNKIALYVGRLEHEKGPDLLAAAAARCNMPVTFVGEGPAEEAVRKANPDADIRGWMDRPALAQMLAQARILVMPSRCVEPFGLAAAEAISVGVPAVVSTTSLLGSLIEKCDAGVVADFHNIDGVAGLLSDLMQDNPRVDAMSRAAYMNANQLSQSKDEWVDHHIIRYDEMVNAANGSRET